MLSSYTNIPELSVPPPSYTQSSYRWYANTDSTTPGSPLAAQNAASTIASQTPFRLRQIVRGDDSSLKSTQDFKLQYAEKVTSCSVASPYLDLVNAASYAGQFNLSDIEDWEENSYMHWTRAGEQLNADYIQLVSGDTSTVVAKGYGFDIPPGHNILSVDFDINLYAENIGGLAELEVQLVKNGQAVGSSYRMPVFEYEYTDLRHTIPYSELGASFTPGDINSSEFGLAIRVLNVDPGALRYIFISYARVGVTHQGDPGEFSHYDNSSIGSSATITATGQDPTDDGRTIVPQQYLETDPFAVSSTLPGGQSALWDFSLVDNGAPDGTYCFRIVKEDGTPLDNYLQYPEITIGEGGGGGLGPTLDQRLRGGQSVIDGVKSPLGWD